MDAITRAKDGPVQILQFNRPDKKNAITVAMYKALDEGLAAGEQDEDVKVHAVLGVPGAFCAGNDIADFLMAAQKGTLGEEVLGFLRRLVTLDKPIVAGVDGVAVGVGTTMLMHCDMVLATQRSLFKTPFVDLGLVPEAASSLVAPRLMGHVRAFQLLAAGEAMDGAGALASGLVNRLVPEADLETETLKLAARLAARPANALRTARRLIKGDPADILARIDEEAEHFRSALKSPEAQAAFLAFMSRK